MVLGSDGVEALHLQTDFKLHPPFLKLSYPLVPFLGCSVPQQREWEEGGGEGDYVLLPVGGLDVKMAPRGGSNGACCV